MYLKNSNVAKVYLKNIDFLKSVFKKGQICKDVLQ